MERIHRDGCSVVLYGSWEVSLHVGKHEEMHFNNHGLVD
jgi:hypothetical protein